MRTFCYTTNSILNELVDSMERNYELLYKLAEIKMYNLPTATVNNLLINPYTGISVRKELLNNEKLLKKGIKQKIRSNIIMNK